MKNKKILILSIIVNIVFLLIICFFISGDKNIIREKQIVKEMTTSALEEDLNAQITQLNKSHTDYANSIEESKKKIASAITDMGIETSSDLTLETMASNIRKISSNKPIEIYGTNSAYAGNGMVYKQDGSSVSGEPLIGEYFNASRIYGMWKFTALKDCEVSYISTQYSSTINTTVESQIVTAGEVISTPHDGIFIMYVLR